MKAGWYNQRLGNVCNIVGGGTPSKANASFYGGDIPWATVRDMRNDVLLNTEHKITNEAVEGSSTNVIPENNVIIATRVGLGKVCMLNQDTAINQDLRGIIPKNGNLSQMYLFWWFKNIAHVIENEGTGATVKGVKLPFVKSLEIPLPPLREQKRIVAILDKAFEGIEKSKANAQKNLNNVRELFESYLQSVFSNKGEGWEEKKLGKIAKVSGGYSFKSKDFEKQGQYQVIRMGNVRPGIIREKEKPVFLSNVEDKVLTRALLLLNDVIITQTGTKNKRDYGFTTIINKENYLLNQRISSIRFSDNYLSKFFLYYSWTNHFKDQYFTKETGTVGQGNVGIKAITEALVPFISTSEQQVITNKIDTLLAETKRLGAIYQQKLNNLEELKKSILKKAFNGELH